MKKLKVFLPFAVIAGIILMLGLFSPVEADSPLRLCALNQGDTVQFAGSAWTVMDPESMLPTTTCCRNHNQYKNTDNFFK